MGWASELVDAADAVAEGAELPCVLDPQDLNTLPAVWLRFDGLGGPVLRNGDKNLTASRVLVTVLVIVAPLDPRRNLEALEPLLETVAGIIPPMSDPRHVAVANLPGGGTPAPAMSYQHELTIGE